MEKRSIRQQLIADGWEEYELETMKGEFACLKRAVSNLNTSIGAELLFWRHRIFGR